MFSENYDKFEKLKKNIFKAFLKIYSYSLKNEIFEDAYFRWDLLVGNFATVGYWPPS